MRTIITIIIAALVSGCALDATRDVRLSAADRLFGVATTKECRAVRAASIADAAADLWPEQDWSMAQAQAERLMENTDLSVDTFNALADAYASALYGPARQRALEAGLIAAEAGTSPLSAVRSLVSVAEVIQGLPEAALIRQRVRADVIACEIDAGSDVA